MAAQHDIESAVASLCLDHRLIDVAAARAVIEQSRTSTSGQSLASRVVSGIGETKVLAAVAGVLGFAYVDLFARDAGFHLDPDLVRGLDLEVLLSYSALPLRSDDGRVLVAMANPNDPHINDYLTSKLGAFSRALAAPNQVQSRLVSLQAEDFSAELPEESPQSKGAPRGPVAPAATAAVRSTVVDWVDTVLSKAVADNASDIHFQTHTTGMLMLRYRVDGVLLPQPVPAAVRGKEREVYGTILNRAADAGSGVDAANVYEPQDGMFSFFGAGRKVDVRLSFAPDVNYGSLVLRLLDSDRLNVRLDDMGFSHDQLEQMRAIVNQSQGLILLAGPTGSGKTTTLYSLLKEVDAVSKNVMTIEDPVEYRLANVRQMQVRPDRGFTFASALRSILRQDPDVILVGEIRDLETGKIAAEAALTGHMVLSSVHAQSSVGVFSRLLNMGVESHMVAGSAKLVVSQRLLRKVHDCVSFSAPDDSEAALLSRFGMTQVEAVARPSGCSGCNNTGYRGRLAVVEALVPTADLRALVAKEAGEAELQAAAVAAGFRPMVYDGLRHVQAGTTTVEEILRVVETSEL